MRELTFDELKSVELGILKNVAKFCDEHGITYCLCGGTMLGAVRHKGFIPWDDDIDIYMPYKDYLRFIEEYKNEIFHVQDIRVNQEYSYAFGKVVDNRTLLIENEVKYYAGSGVYIDVFPLMLMPNNKLLQSILYVLIRFLNRLYVGSHLIKANKQKYHGFKLCLVRLFAMCSKICSSQTYIKIQYILFNLFMPYNSCYIASVNLSPKNGIMPAEWFDEMILTDFEDVQFKIPREYDRILTRNYGDYMILPPKEQQISNHSFVAYWKD